MSPSYKKKTHYTFNTIVATQDFVLQIDHANEIIFCTYTFRLVYNVVKGIRKYNTTNDVIVILKKLISVHSML